MLTQGSDTGVTFLSKYLGTIIYGGTISQCEMCQKASLHVTETIDHHGIDIELKFSDTQVP